MGCGGSEAYEVVEATAVDAAEAYSVGADDAVVSDGGRSGGSGCVVSKGGGGESCGSAWAAAAV